VTIINITKQAFLDYQEVQGAFNPYTEAELAAEEAGMSLKYYYAIMEHYLTCKKFFIDSKVTATSIEIDIDKK